MIRWKWPTTKYVSCRYMSATTSARYRPVKPPTPNVNTIPRQNSIGVLNRMAPRQSVPSQFSTSSAVGTEMIMVSTMKLSPSSGLSPVVNMWCP